MYLYKSLFSINKLNQNLVSFACSHCGAGWVHAFDSREVWRRYGFVSFVFAQDQVSMSSKVRLVISSNVSLYRIDFTCVTNRLRVVSKRLCMETTGFPLNLTKGTKLDVHFDSQRNK